MDSERSVALTARSSFHHQQQQQQCKPPSQPESVCRCSSDVCFINKAIYVERSPSQVTVAPLPPRRGVSATSRTNLVTFGRCRVRHGGSTDDESPESSVMSQDTRGSQAWDDWYQRKQTEFLLQKKKSEEQQAAKKEEEDMKKLRREQEEAKNRARWLRVKKQQALEKKTSNEKQQQLQQPAANNGAKKSQDDEDRRKKLEEWNSRKEKMIKEKQARKIIEEKLKEFQEKENLKRLVESEKAFEEWSRRAGTRSPPMPPIITKYSKWKFQGYVNPNEWQV